MKGMPVATIRKRVARKEKMKSGKGTLKKGKTPLSPQRGKSGDEEVKNFQGGIIYSCFNSGKALGKKGIGGGGGGGVGVALHRVLGGFTEGGGGGVTGREASPGLLSLGGSQPKESDEKVMTNMGGGKDFLSKRSLQ